MEHSARKIAGMSQYEVVDAGTITYTDPERAHKAAGDPGYTQKLEGCGLCAAKKAAQEALAETINDAESN